MKRLSPPPALLNGSSLGQRPTGIGVVMQGLAIPNTLSSDFGRQGHLRRLLWTQYQLPALLKQTGASFLLSPLPAPILQRGYAPLYWPTT